jgi:integrase
MYNALKKNGRTARRERFGNGLSDSYVRRIHMTLHEAMEHARRKHLVGINPTVGTAVPKQNSAEMKVLNESQMANYLEVIRSDPFWYDFFYLELTTGLRLGELCALCWNDFDSEPGTLRITRTLGGSGDVIAVGDPKTDAGKRLIYLPASTKEMLTERMKNRYSQWIFPGLDRPERPVSKSSAYHRHKRFLKDAGLPNIRFHDLRHTFATHAMRSGVDAKTLSGILGHTNASFTLDTYTHVTGEMQRRAADIVGGFMEEIFGKELKPWQTDEKKEKEV